MREYLVLCIEEGQLYWFDFRRRRAILPDAGGLYRSRVFPGLWLDGAGLLARNSARIVAGVQQGLASPQHARFVKRLQAGLRKRP